MKISRIVLRAGIFSRALVAAAFLSGCAPQQYVSTEPQSVFAPAEADTEKDDVAEAYRLYSAARLALVSEDYDSAYGFLAEAVKLDPFSVHLCVSLADVQRRVGDMEGALARGAECVRRHPESPEPFVLLGDLHALAGDEAIALENYLEALRLGSGDAQRLRLQAADLTAKKGLYREALEHLDILLENNPDHRIARYFCGRIHLQLEQYPEAEACLLAALESGGNVEPVLFDLGTLYQITGRQEEAAEIYERVLELNPGNLAAMDRIIAIYLDSGEPDRAEPHMERLKETAGRDDWQRGVLGLAYLRQGRYDRAIEELEATVRENPDDSKSRHYLATAYEKVGEADLAVSHFNLVPDDSPYYFNSRVSIAFIYHEMEENERAEDVLQELREAGETRPELYLMLSTLLEQRQDYDGAEGLVHEGLVYNPQDDELMFRLGVIFDKKGDKEACVEQMKMVVELNPEHAEALNYIGYTWAEQGIRLEEAEALIEKALAIKPGSAYIVDSLGWVYFQQKRYPEALEQLERAAAMAPGDPVITEHLGDVYVKANRVEDALFQYRKALELNHPDAGSVRKKITDLEKRRKR